MELISTDISGAYIHMRFADNLDKTQAQTWIDFRVPLAGLTLGTASGEQPLGDAEKRWLGSIRLAALRHVRDLIGEETQSLSGRVSH
jgi:hypothetical protein